MTANVAATESISGLTPSTAYKIYFVAKDAASNVQTAVASVAVTTAAAADTTPPTTTGGPSVSGTTSTGTTLSATLNENGTGYYLVQAATAAAPSVAAVQAGTPFAMNANVAASQSIAGLTAATDYKIHFVAKDAANNVQATVSSVAVTTPAAPSAATGLLNDTGVTASQCYQAGSGTLVSCSSAAALALNNAQDGMSGRDANGTTNGSADGKLGFSFAAVAGGCVRDNVTGLMWEVKTNDGGLRDWNTTYTNYGDGRAGDASAYVTAVNASGLCGHNDWRLPSADELQSIVDYGVAYPGPTIDTTWFPNTKGSVYWTSSPYVGYSAYAWVVDFDYGYVGYGYRGGSGYVRLVR